ncbi:ATP-binding cassette domain-containing protein [Lyngbya confervoides]|uniref:ATP-binding cassette domain-containing protein n=1 Tax=Lyngbya confervoides BDU141951 TaxID=1574623 RepID=A0ABD4TA76_9CYAN|nr:ATP-binding cassette domain-containing protein [Lyngbya confervoides]MCM1985275.1 ATP-binding cassette domain-containing protein [Lyngbya confervoides BDU141951]
MVRAAAAALEFQQVTLQTRPPTGTPAGGSARVKNLSFQVRTGEVLALLGRSGSGKTTTLKLMNGLLLPTQGQVWVQGQTTQDWDLIALRRRMGYVIQEIGLLPHLTVAQNVGLVPSLLGWTAGKIQHRAYDLLAQVGLPPEEFAQRYPVQLSGGQRQRVGVARALAANPDILLLDEPFAALDPVTRFEVQTLFLDLQRSLQKTVVLITHDIQEALRLGDRIGLMQQGTLVSLTSAQAFMQLDHPEAQCFQRTVMEGSVHG